MCITDMIRNRINYLAVAILATFILIRCSTGEFVKVDTCSLVLSFNNSILFREAHSYSSSSGKREKLLIQLKLDDSGDKSIQLEVIKYLDENGVLKDLDRKEDYDFIIQVFDSLNVICNSYYFEFNGSINECSKFWVEPMKQ